MRLSARRRSVPTRAEASHRSLLIRRCGSEVGEEPWSEVRVLDRTRIYGKGSASAGPSPNAVSAAAPGLLEAGDRAACVSSTLTTASPAPRTWDPSETVERQDEVVAHELCRIGLTLGNDAVMGGHTVRLAIECGNGAHRAI